MGQIEFSRCARHRQPAEQHNRRLRVLSTSVAVYLVPTSRYWCRRLGAKFGTAPPTALEPGPGPCTRRRKRNAPKTARLAYSTKATIPSTDLFQNQPFPSSRSLASSTSSSFVFCQLAHLLRRIFADAPSYRRNFCLAQVTQKPSQSTKFLSRCLLQEMRKPTRTSR